MRKLISFVATFALLFNSLAAPLTVLAQTVEPTPTPEATATPFDNPSPTPEATIAPTDLPTATPDATPTDLVTPTPNLEGTPLDSNTPMPTDQPVVTQAPESNPTVQGPPEVSASIESTSVPTASPTAIPLASPEATAQAGEAPKEHGNITTTVVDNIDLSTITLLNSNVDTPTITTDKPDYSPTSVVLITGTGFIAHKDYTLEIVSTDQPPVDFTDQIKADNSGNISYAYQLDGTYRPNYTAHIKDGVVVVATTTFTDTGSPSLQSVSVGNQNPSSITQGSSASYVVTAKFTGPASPACTATFSLTSQLPSGVAASFSPSSVTDPTTTSTLTLTTDSTTPNGTTSFTVQATGSGGCNETVTNTGNLAVGISGSGGAANLDQYANDAPTGWINGDLNSNKATYREGDSVPYRMLLSGITSGSHTLVIQWDTTKGGLHAIDYITSFDRTVHTANPCDGVSGCGSPTTFAIPTDTNITGFTPDAGHFTIYNGTITSVSGYTLTGAYSGDSSTSISITFTATNTTPVIAWGGHIGSQVNWGVGNSASSISGSPYHTRLVSLDGSGGNQDRALAAASILPTPTFNTQVSANPVYLGNSVTDTATLSGSANNPPAVTGTVNFYLCGPDSSNPDCTTGGTQIGSGATISNGSATSGAFSPTLQSQLGNYCFRAEYTPDATALYSPFTHTNLTTECFTVSNPPTGTIELKKVWSGTGGQTTLNILNAAGGTVDSQQTGASGAGPLTTGQNTVNTGTYYLSETGDLTDYTTSPLSCFNDANNNGTNDNESAVTVGTGDGVQVDSGQHVICTYTNTRKTGTITFQKLVDDQTSVSGWTFTVGGNVYHSGESDTFDTGTYTVTESGSSNYTPYSVDGTVCSDLNGSAATLTVTPNGGVCTFTNHRNVGTLSIHKQDQNGDPMTGVSFAISGTATASGQTNTSGDLLFSNIPTGGYTVTETVPTDYHWTSTSGSCTTSTNPSDVTVTTNGQESCTFVNTRDTGTVIVHKDVRGPNDENTTDISNTFKVKIDGANEQGITDNGTVTYTGVTTGSHGITESFIPTGYSLYSITGDGTIDVTYGKATDVYIINRQDPASISGTKYDDNQNVLSGWTINLFSCAQDFSTCPNLIKTTPTTGSGYIFDNLVAGFYRVQEEMQTGWTNVTSLYHDITLVAGQESTQGNDFVNFQFGKITACKYNDYNDNGQYDAADDSPLSGISIKLSDATHLINTKETGVDGCTTFTGLAAGTYIVEEDYADPDLSGYYSTNGITHYDVNIISGSDETRIFLNTLYRTISGRKYNDLNGNRSQDAGEPGLPGWTIFVDYNNNGLPDDGGPSTTTDANGNYEFTNLVADSYTIAEVIKPGWTQTMPASGHYDVDVHTALTSTGNDFGNQVRGSITITKDAIPDNSQIFTFNSPDQLGTFTLYDNGDPTQNQKTFSDLGSNNYTISEQSIDGWNLTDIQCAGDDNPTIDVASGAIILRLDRPGENISCTFTNTRKTGELMVHKQVQSEVNGAFNSADDGPFSWGLAEGDTPYTMGVSQILNTGNYEVYENDVLNYHPVGWYYTEDGSCEEPNELPANVTVTDENPTDITICNARDTGWLNVYKLADTTGNGEFSQNSSIFTWGTQSDNTPNVMGDPIVLPTDNYNIYENSVAGYDFVGWFWGIPDSQYSCTSLPEGREFRSFPTNIGVSYDKTTEITLCNQFIPVPNLKITKSNSNSNISAGNTVTYTLTVNNEGTVDMNNITVTDVLPSGFTYVAGSTSGSTSDDPTPSGSVLSWKNVSIPAGKSWSVSYNVSTATDLVDGLYTNFASCQTTFRKEPLKCDPDPVSSTVSIGHGISYGGNLTGQVLGISTQLPATGSPTFLLLVALGLLGAGIILNVYNTKKRKGESKGL